MFLVYDTAVKTVLSSKPHEHEFVSNELFTAYLCDTFGECLDFQHLFVSAENPASEHHVLSWHLNQSSTWLIGVF